MKTTSKPSPPPAATTHTPGPWEYFPAKNQDMEATFSIRGNAEFLATMDTVSVDGGPYRAPANAEANARLIAAAPAMLAALQDALVYLDACAEEQRYDAGADDAGPLADQARAALAAVSEPRA